MSNGKRNGNRGPDRSPSEKNFKAGSRGKSWSKDSRGNDDRAKSKNRKQRRDDHNSARSYTDASRSVGSDERYGGNDISWYSKYPNLLVAAGAFPYPYRPGMTLKTGAGLPAGATKLVPFTMDKLPGVMCLDWVPSLGYSESSTDPASITAKEIYARVRSAFSGALDADAPDFVMYLMALDSIFSYIAWYKRVYRTLNAYSPENYATPDQLLYAYGFSDEEITTMRANKALMWQHINSLVLMSRKFTCPAVMDIFNRHYWLNDNVYTDAASINSQFYVFNQIGYFAYSEVAVPSQPTISASGLKYVEFTHTPGTVVDGLYAFGRTLIENLVTWDDAYTISGYLKRAYDGVPTFTVEEIPYDQALEPVYNQEVLLQIENSKAVYAYTDSGFWKDYVVAQDPETNAVISPCEFKSASAPSGGTAFLQAFGADETELFTQRADAPTVADNVIASRLHASTTWVVDEDVPGKFKIVVSAGTEIPVAWSVILYRNGKFEKQSGITQWVKFAGMTSQAYSHGQLLIMAAVSQFDWHPLLTLYDFIGTSPNFTECSIAVLGDLHNTTTVSKEQLQQLHRICLYSEFNAFQQ